jgi:hypothetical protein
MVPAGTYSLSYQHGVIDPNGNALTHLEILGPVTIIGSTSGSGVIINGNNYDTIFTINPGPFGSYNPTGNSNVFSLALENLTIENGKNINNPNATMTGLENNVGGCINWDADSTGNLSITNSAIENCTILWGAAAASGHLTHLEEALEHLRSAETRSPTTQHPRKAAGSAQLPRPQRFPPPILCLPVTRRTILCSRVIPPLLGWVAASIWMGLAHPHPPRHRPH